MISQVRASSFSVLKLMNLGAKGPEFIGLEAWRTAVLTHSF
jgi:hypothetical protein